MVLAGLGVMVYSLFRSAPTEATDLARLEFRVEVLSQTVLGGVLLVVGTFIFVGTAMARVARALKSRNVQPAGNRRRHGMSAALGTDCALSTSDPSRLSIRP